MIDHPGAVASAWLLAIGFWVFVRIKPIRTNHGQRELVRERAESGLRETFAPVWSLAQRSAFRFHVDAESDLSEESEWLSDDAFNEAFSVLLVPQNRSHLEAFSQSARKWHAADRWIARLRSCVAILDVAILAPIALAVVLLGYGFFFGQSALGNVTGNPTSIGVALSESLPGWLLGPAVLFVGLLEVWFLTIWIVLGLKGVLDD